MAGRIGIIGGTGMGAAWLAGEAREVETPFGTASLTICPQDGGGEIALVARHGEGHSVAPHRVNYRANIAALKAWGASAALATSAVGSLRADLTPGDFVVLDDLLDMTRGEPVTFVRDGGAVTHADMSAPYDPALRGILLQTAGDMAPARVHDGGVYLCVSGPRYETAAEVRLFASWGAAVVGMTGAPEVVLCREAGLPYAGVALVTNYATGLGGREPLAHADVEARMASGRAALSAWLLRASRAALLLSEKGRMV